jgi:ATP-dependent RNA helicase DDX46/PRP5
LHSLTPKNYCCCCHHNCCRFAFFFPQAGYPCLSLHGGKEQSDRECTIADFKGAVCNILVATSVAARGLDVRDLVLVVNYDVPNHHEDYVHR